MRILFTSFAFAPSIGGIEQSSALLAGALVARGHDLRLVTQTAQRGGAMGPYEVIRQPSIFTLIRLIFWADVVVQNNLSLAHSWPLAFWSKPWIVIHNSSHFAQGRGFKSWLRRRFARRAAAVFVSPYIAEQVGPHVAGPSTVQPNPYDAKMFSRVDAKGEISPGTWKIRPFDLTFVGRLVSEKGANCVVAALEEMAKTGALARYDKAPHICFVGDGPERCTLEKAALSLGEQCKIEFLGWRSSREIAEILSQSKVQIIPSRYDEPFGIVALEGLASGCRVIASQRGGLPFALGGLGHLAPSVSAEALGKIIAQVWALGPVSADEQAKRDAHLTRHKPDLLAQRLDVFITKVKAAA